ncbi:MAG: NAD(P)/FAD-dependent oxidoreductase [Thermoanaerobaculia bacterium]
MTQPYDTIVVGAGPAGAAAATMLARAARRVLLLEKDEFPRPKVCGEFLSSGALACLEELGARGPVEELNPERIERGVISWPGGPRVCFRVPAPALGLSRYRLDHLLASGARQAGAEVWFGARVLSVEGSEGRPFRVRLIRAQTEEEVQSPTVIGAWGRWDALDRRLERGFLLRRARFFGWSRDYGGDTEWLAGQVRLYIFPGGYCGLSRVEGNKVNLAGVVSEKVRSRLPAGWTGILEHVRSSHRELDTDLSRLAPGPVGFIGTGPVFFTAKPPTERGMLITGDAAGVLDSYSGEGQAMALASGILAAQCVERWLDGQAPRERLPDIYERAWRRRFGRRFGWSQAFRLLMLNPSLGRLAARLAGERLVRLAMGTLS